MQLEYAALDAAVLLHIFRHVGNHTQATDGHAKMEWKSHLVWVLMPTSILLCIAQRYIQMYERSVLYVSRIKSPLFVAWFSCVQNLCAITQLGLWRSPDFWKICFGADFLKTLGGFCATLYLHITQGFNAVNLLSLLLHRDSFFSFFVQFSSTCSCSPFQLMFIICADISHGQLEGGQEETLILDRGPMRPQ